MAVQHVYSNTVADGTNSSIVRPSDWNSFHNQLVTVSGNTAGQSTLSGTNVVFQGGNNVTLSVATAAGAATIVVSGANTVAQSVQTQPSGNIAGTGFTSTTTAGVVIVGTNNTAGLSIAVPNYLTTSSQSVQTQPSGNIAGAGFTSTTTAGVVPAATHNSAGLSLAVPNWITTQSVQTQASGNIAGSGFTTTTIAGSTVGATHDSLGLKLAVPAYITTQTVQPDINQGISNVGNTAGNTGTASSGIQVFAGSNMITASMSTAAGQSTLWFNATQSVQTQAAGNIAGTTTGFTGANVSGSMTHNTAGLALSLSVAAPGGGGAINVAAGTTNGNVQTLSFVNSNGVSFGLNGSTITASAAGGGGGGATLSDWFPYQMALSSQTSVGVGSVFFCPLIPQQNVSFSVVEVLSSNAMASAAGAFTRGMTLNYGLYSENGSTLSLMSSSSVGLTLTQSSSTALGGTYSDGAGSFTFSTANSTHSGWNNNKIVSLPFAGTMAAGGLYFWAQNMSTSSAGSNVALTLSQMFNVEATQASFGAWGGTFSTGTNKSIVQEPYGFIRSATSAGLPASCAYSDMSNYSNLQPYLYFEA